MTALPAALAPWATQLAIFPPEIAATLGSLARGLAGVLGAWEMRAADRGSPDGLGGIARRGPYDRLLATEWLLHDELPDEFLRRVVSGEHAFLARAYRSVAQTRRSSVLFDSGVDQLGAPRIAQLAALIALSRRAELAGASLTWGVLQDESCTPHDAVDAAGVTALLRARRERRPSPADFERWGAIVDAQRPSERWLVGPERLGPEARRARTSLLTLDDLLEPRPPGASDRVVVKAYAAGTTRVREVTLELPPSRVAVRLLRDPFRTAVAPRQVALPRLDPHAGFVFTPDGRRLHVRGEHGTLITFQIPNSPRAGTGPPVAFTPPRGHHVIAVGQSRGKPRALVVTTDGAAMYLHTLSKRGGVSERRARVSLPRGYDLAVPPCLRPLGVLDFGHACYVDAHGSLVEIKDDALAVHDEEASVVSNATRDRFVYLREASVRSSAVVVTATAAGLVFTPSGFSLWNSDRTERVFFGAPGADDLVAFATPTGAWRCWHRGRAFALDPPSGRTLVGVVKRAPLPTKACFVALDPARTRIELYGEAGSEVVASTGDPIAFAAASDATSDIAYVTRGGELIVYSCAWNAVVLRVSPTGVR